MANNLNLCQFIGNLGADPETRFMQDGSAVTNVRIACNWKSKNAEGTEWVSVVFFGRLAEVVGEYLRKGSKIYVSGRLRTRKWTDQSGADRWSTEIVAERMEMLDSRQQGQAGSQGYAGDGGRQYGTAQGGTAPRGSASNPHQPPNQGHTGNQPPSFDDFDDDIPF